MGDLGFDFGQSYLNGLNVRVFFKTFLSASYVPTLDEVIEKNLLLNPVDAPNFSSSTAPY